MVNSRCISLVAQICELKKQYDKLIQEVLSVARASDSIQDSYCKAELPFRVSSKEGEVVAVRDMEGPSVFGILVSPVVLNSSRHQSSEWRCLCQLWSSFEKALKRQVVLEFFLVYEHGTPLLIGGVSVYHDPASLNSHHT